MWEKYYDRYMCEVGFIINNGDKVRELRFEHNICIDSIYKSANDYSKGAKSSETIYRLNDDFTKYVSPQDSIMLSNELEKKIVISGIDFSIPPKYLVENDD